MRLSLRNRRPGAPPLPASAGLGRTSSQSVECTPSPPPNVCIFGRGASGLQAARRTVRYLCGVTVLIVLAAAGLGLLIFGGLVLLKFPDKPGGTIEARAFGQGFHFSSIGAGLPIIVIGAGLLIATAFIPTSEEPGPPSIAPSPTDTTATSPTITPTVGPTPPAVPTGPSVCPDRLLADVKKDRVQTMEVGATAQRVVREGQSKTELFGMRLTVDGQLVGAILLQYFPTSEIFKIRGVVDSKCGRVEDLRHVDDPQADTWIMQNDDPIRIVLHNRAYRLTFHASDLDDVIYGQFVSE